MSLTPDKKEGLKELMGKHLGTVGLSEYVRMQGEIIYNKGKEEVLFAINDILCSTDTDRRILEIIKEYIEDEKRQLEENQYNM
jgi:hypothetical protein